MTKIPLYRGGRGIMLRHSSHVISPAVLSDVTCALLHFKFVDEGLELFGRDLEQNTRSSQCKSRHRNYIRHLENTGGALPIDTKCTVRYNEQ